MAREVPSEAPLAARMRPRTFDEFFGQGHLVGPTSAFRRAVEADRLGSAILWGPPGVGKTTLAEIVANVTDAAFERVSAVSAGVADLRRIVEDARRRRNAKAGSTDLFSEGSDAKRTILFIDEIHRFNKGQQDAILPYVEDGTVTLIGATTENPSFEVNAALLSRARVYVLSALEDEEVHGVIQRALADPRGLDGRVSIETDAEQALVNLANGDARAALNMLELCAAVAEGAPISLEVVRSAIQQRTVLYDKSGEQHYDLISALHKSVRDSDVDGSLYWLARMLEGGEDPLYLARRIVRMATEDIGLADPHALPLTIAAQQAMHFQGMPEGALALAEAVAYLALAPKSNSVYVAYKLALGDVRESRNDPVPLHLRNAPTGLMKGLGYGKGYQYAHDFEDAKVDQTHLPDSLAGRVYYRSSGRGFEAGTPAAEENDDSN
ncbi:replication-associated recombination protein A [Fimbriimonas ginsengisoli]|uniref:Recombination factor protein RarA n=1 Tax=Fimbriimonas ginsengisoli Gsoil 348 TaxID=661478 RepID=A0A068NYG5_FIMGI|nr:replication-associated recombination protein A [Fimbriimonas ginsengisoli]AIE88110.1 recombination factor protein RarA [Fimbriimonas ginsengisoli Gsoil 348]